MMKTKLGQWVAALLAVLMMCDFWLYMPGNKVYADSQADALVSVALAEEGYTEGANNYSKYGEWYYNNVSKEIDYAHADWCAMFISWCARQAGIPTSIIKNNAWAGSMSSSKRTGNFGGQYYPKGSITPQKGDIAYYGWGSSSSVHVEIVISTSGNTFTSIGGNTGGGTQVYIHRNYSFTSSDIVGFERPNYSNSKPVPDPPMLSINQTTGTPDDVISITWSAVEYADSYWLHIYKDGNDYINHTLNQELSYLAKYPAGNYTVYVVSCNNKGEALSSVDFSIYGSNPENPYPQISKSLYSADEIVEVTWKNTANTTHYWLHTYKDGEEFENADMYNNLSYARIYPAGHYTLYIASYNNYGESHNCVEFTVYDSIPKAPELEIEKDLYLSNESITVTWNDTPITTHYWLHTYKDGKEFENKDMHDNLSYSCTYPAGKYTLFIASYNNYGESHSYVEFTVYDKGDCNNDGKFTVSDVVLLQKWLLAIPNTTLTDWQAGDMNGNGTLNGIDLCLMKQALLAKSPS